MTKRAISTKTRARIVPGAVVAIDFSDTQHVPRDEHGKPAKGVRGVVQHVTTQGFCVRVGGDANPTDLFVDDENASAIFIVDDK